MECEVKTLQEIPPPMALDVMETAGPLVACDPTEMARAQGNMVSWASAMQEQIEKERAELTEAVEIATRNKWGNKAILTRQLKRAEQRLDFYAKIESALKAGYLVVPNFDMDVFAIRTSREWPTGTWQEHRSQDQVAGFLPQGDGENVSPVPTYDHSTHVVQNYQKENVTRSIWKPLDFQGVDFPMEVARPVVMEATAKALRLKLFDEIGIARDSKSIRRGDPMILGRLRNPRPNHPDVTLFIAWFFDPRNV